MVQVSRSSFHCQFLPDPDGLLRFGGGSGPIHFAGVRCSGNENNLLDCPIDFVGNQITHCQHFEDAGVRCLNGEGVESFE